MIMTIEGEERLFSRSAGQAATGFSTRSGLQCPHRWSHHSFYCGYWGSNWGSGGASFIWRSLIGT